MSLVGRERERAQLASLLRSGGGALLITGEPGAGKSALLRSLAGPRAVGVEAEQDLPYAGLHQVLHPLLSAVAPGLSAERRAWALAQAPEAFTRAVLDVSR